jgi:hypothetical protein
MVVQYNGYIIELPVFKLCSLHHLPFALQLPIAKESVILQTRIQS